MWLYNTLKYGCFAFIALCIIVPIIQGISKSAKENAQRREQERRKAEQDEANRQKAAKRAAEQAERERKADERRRERERKQAAKLEAARQLAEYNKAALQAEKEMRELKGKTSEQSKAAETVKDEPTKDKPQRPANIPNNGNGVFVGQVVSFTGTLPGMTRRAAIAAVEANGGKAFSDIPAGTTLLVVGNKPGANKLDKADKWIDQVRKITPGQFKAMLDRPLTLTPDEFAARFAPSE